jgi:hypothetical protein
MSMRIAVRAELRHVVVWAAATFVFHLAWESTHVWLYTIWSDPDRWYVARAVLHCTLGDVVIALVPFGVTSWLFLRTDWPMRRPLSGTALVVAATVLFTVWSEWNNVYRVGLWAYAPEMPTILGIGLSPLLQWILIPPLTVLTFRTVYSLLSKLGNRSLAPEPLTSPRTTTTNRSGE